MENTVALLLEKRGKMIENVPVYFLTLNRPVLVDRDWLSSMRVLDSGLIRR